MGKKKGLFDNLGFDDFEAVAESFSDLFEIFEKAGEGFVKAAGNSIKDVSAKLSEKQGYDKLHTYTILGDANKVRDLLHKGHNPDAQSREGVTPAHLAVMHAKVDVLRELLEAGAKINAITKAGFAPMHVLSSCARGNEEFDMAELLLRYGGRMDARKSDGETVSESLISSNKGYLRKYMERLPIDETDHVKVVNKKLGPKIDGVELRFALNKEDFPSVFDILGESDVEFKAFEGWAKDEGYSDVLIPYLEYIIEEI